MDARHKIEVSGDIVCDSQQSTSVSSDSKQRTKGVAIRKGWKDKDRVVRLLSPSVSSIYKFKMRKTSNSFWVLNPQEEAKHPSMHNRPIGKRKKSSLTYNNYSINYTYCNATNSETGWLTNQPWCCTLSHTPNSKMLRVIEFLKQKPMTDTHSRRQ